MKELQLSNPFGTSIRIKGLFLHVRPGVAFRERKISNGRLFYLSLLDDEIDDRFEQLLATDILASKIDGLTSITSRLELTDALVFCGEDGLGIVARGGSCTFPLYWSSRGNELHISTYLPVLGGEAFSKAGLVTAVTAASLHGPYEVNFCPATPLHDWLRLRRGIVATFVDHALSTENAITVYNFTDKSWSNEEQIVHQHRAAFAAYGQSQRQVKSSVLELSGGFDSTLAAAAAISTDRPMNGLSMEFPFDEFRFEAAIQSAVAEALRVSRTIVDGTTMFPYAPPLRKVQFDEPTIFMTGIRHSEYVATFAASLRANRIYVGHGGDQLFSTDLTSAEDVRFTLTKEMFSTQSRRIVRKSLDQIRQLQWRLRITGCWIYDGRQDVWTKERFGATVRTPFTDLAIFRAAILWSRWCAAQKIRPDKSILAQALGHLLPTAVIARKGKVAYDGVWTRAYRLHNDHIALTIDRAAKVLEFIGISPAWLIRRTRALGEWKDVSDREVMAGYALAFWLSSWGIERPTDVKWA